ncbi:hypothetical protein, partial [Weizmannia sp. CD-2023]|uniref:hypothetical protein n=1 Tax=Weizmannia sp. CD-2023 TaxID=3037263 RepID=UPI002E2124F3|nr:hypothetical protein [Weizmannia sp. CD-2023]
TSPLSIFIRKYYIFSENYTEQVKHGSRKCTKRVSWNTRYLNLVEKNLTHTTLPAALTTAGATRNIIKIDGKIGKTDDKEE